MLKYGFSYYQNTADVQQATANWCPRTFNSTHDLKQHKETAEVTFWQPLTVHLKSVRLEELLVAVSVTGVVAHVGRRHLGDVQRAVVSKVLAEGAENIKGEGGRRRKRQRETLNNRRHIRRGLKQNEKCFNGGAKKKKSLRQRGEDKHVSPCREMRDTVEKNRKKKYVESGALFDQSQSKVRDTRRDTAERPVSESQQAREIVSRSNSFFVHPGNLGREDATGSDRDLNGWVWKLRDAQSSESRSRRVSVAAKALR